MKKNVVNLYYAKPIGSFAIDIGSLIGVDIIFGNFLNIFDGVGHDYFLTGFSVDIKNLSGQELFFELGGGSGILEFGAKLFKCALDLIGEVVADP